MPTARTDNRPIQVLMLGIEECIADQLGGILRDKQQPFRFAPFADAAEVIRTTDTRARRLVFCAAESKDTLGFLHSIKASEEPLFVVVITRTFDIKRWLDLLEAGAADYCLFPIDEEHIEWILSKV